MTIDVCLRGKHSGGGSDDENIVRGWNHSQIVSASTRWYLDSGDGLHLEISPPNWQYLGENEISRS